MPTYPWPCLQFGVEIGALRFEPELVVTVTTNGTQ